LLLAPVMKKEVKTYFEYIKNFKKWSLFGQNL
jgi:hypothetical protein